METLASGWKKGIACMAFCIVPVAYAQTLPAYDVSPLALATSGNADASSIDSPPDEGRQDHPSVFSRQYGHMLWQDVGHVITAPAYWDSKDWDRFGIFSAAVLGTGILFDRALRNTTQNHQSRGLDRVANAFEPFGRQYAFYTLGGFYLEGALRHDDKAMYVAEDGLASSLIAAGLIEPSLKIIFGRSRPRDEQGVAHFEPFRNSNASFPSGHSTEAFAVASVIADHYEEPWVKTVSYGAATMVAFARVYHNAHFTSDVLAGALIGKFTGDSVVSFNNQQRALKVSFIPMIGPGEKGLVVQARF